MNSFPSKPPKSFWIVAIILLLWNIMGVLSFTAHVMITEDMIAEYSAAEQALYHEYPVWTIVLFAIATIGGLMGALGLVLRRKWAFISFVISILAVLPQMTHNVFFTSSIEVFGMVEAITMPLFVVLLGIFSVWFSKYASQKAWLR